MKLTDLVEKLAAWTPKRITLHTTPRIVHESRKVAQRLRDIEATVNVIDLKDLYACLSAAMVSGNWGAISKREWKYVADCLNSGEPRLVDDNAFLEEYLKRLNEQHSRLHQQFIFCFSGKTESTDEYQSLNGLDSCRDPADEIFQRLIISISAAFFGNKMSNPNF